MKNWTKMTNTEFVDKLLKEMEQAEIEQSNRENEEFVKYYYTQTEKGIKEMRMKKFARLMA